MAVKLVPGINDLATVNPALAAQWDFVVNGNLKPTMFSAGSGKKVGWICEKGHHWEATIASRNAGAGCPACARDSIGERTKNRYLVKSGSLAVRNPKLASEWHPTKNGDLLPTMVNLNTHQVVWWLGSCGHEWTASVKARNRGHGCPYCSGRKALPGFNDLASCYPELSKEWHPVKNEALKPTDVTVGSHKKVWWRCSKGHEWETIVKSRVKGDGCPVCSGQMLVSGINDLATRFPEIANEWHPEKKGAVMPYNIAPGSHTRVWWQCSKGHEWQASPNHRTSQIRNCPYCASNPKVLPGENDLVSRYPEVAKEWHPLKNGSLTPDHVTANSSRRVWWKCSKGHEWQTSVDHRAKGSQCPICSGGMQSSFPEQAIFYYVKAAYPDAVNGYTDLFHNHGMELDIYVPSVSFGIEYDGITWHKGMTSQTREAKKYQVCRDNGIKLIRIREDDLNTDESACDILLFVGNDLNQAIKALAQYLPLLSGIDVERDKDLIVSSYKKILSEGSLAALNPELVSEWHPTKNGSLTPDMFSPSSNHKAWWICRLGHEWQATFDSRTRGTGCPYCSGNRVLPGFNDLATKRPDLMKEWNWQKNIALDPTHIAAGSGKRAFWVCAKGHEWQVEISCRNKGHGCPYCAGVKTWNGSVNRNSVD